MSLDRLVALACALIIFIAPLTLLAANEYYWPAHYDSVEYKVKSHAIRGRLTLSLGTQVKIGDKVYQQLVVETDPGGLPGQTREVYIRADEQGLYSRYSTSPQDKEVLDLALPVEVGKSWQTYDEFGNPTKRIIEGTGDCSFKRAGSFKDCVRVTFKTPDGNVIAVFAPQFGEVAYARANGFDRRTMVNK